MQTGEFTSLRGNRKSGENSPGRAEKSSQLIIHRRCFFQHRAGMYWAFGTTLILLANIRVFNPWIPGKMNRKFSLKRDIADWVWVFKSGSECWNVCNGWLLIAFSKKKPCMMADASGTFPLVCGVFFTNENKGVEKTNEIHYFMRIKRLF